LQSFETDRVFRPDANSATRSCAPLDCTRFRGKWRIGNSELL